MMRGSFALFAGRISTQVHPFEDSNHRFRFEELLVSNSTPYDSCLAQDSSHKGRAVAENRSPNAEPFDPWNLQGVGHCVNFRIAGKVVLPEECVKFSSAHDGSPTSARNVLH